MIDHIALREKIDLDYPIDTEKNISISLNTENINGKRAISSEEIKLYLFTYGLWTSIKNSSSDASKTAIDALEVFPEFDITVTDIENSLINTLDDLVSDNQIPLFTNTHKDAILAMGSITQSWAQQNFGSSISIKDIRIANSLNPEA